jgi:hypothetical protein
MILHTSSVQISVKEIDVHKIFHPSCREFNPKGLNRSRLPHLAPDILPFNNLHNRRSMQQSY